MESDQKVISSIVSVSAETMLSNKRTPMQQANSSRRGIVGRLVGATLVLPLIRFTSTLPYSSADRRNTLAAYAVPLASTNTCNCLLSHETSSNTGHTTSRTVSDTP